MTFPHSLGEFDERECKFYNVDFVRDSESLIEHYAARNGLEICDEKLTGSKSIYWFKKADVSKAESQTRLKKALIKCLFTYI